MAGRDGPSLAAVYDRVAAHLVGRERELTLVLAAVAAGRDIILEGPPGTSKSTLLRAITAEWGIPMVFVEGNADLTPSKLIGNVGTTRLSTSVHDRICRLAIGYQDAAAERGIVALRAPLPSVAPGLYQRLVGDAVAVTRATREHPDIRQGSSVRAGTSPRGAALASWPACGTGAARTTSTWTGRWRSWWSTRCRTRTTSSSGSGSGPGAACCCWSTCPARCGASGSAPPPPPSARWPPS